MKARVLPWRNRGLVYLAIPKAACSSVKYALRVARGLPLPDPIWKIHDMEWPEEMKFDRVRNSGILSFTVVRDPVDRLMSCFLSKFHRDRIRDLKGDHPEVELDWTFRRFVEFVMTTNDKTCNEHLTSQTELVSDEQGVIPTKILKFESLDKEWIKCFPSSWQIPDLLRLNFNGSQHPHVSHHHQRMIAERYRSDYVQFGYRTP